MVLLKCPRCEYSWESNSMGMYTVCPRCRTSVKIRTWEKYKEDVLDGKDKVSDNTEKNRQEPNSSSSSE